MDSDPQERKPRRRRRRRKPVGTPPGTVTVDPNAPKPAISAIAYGPDACSEPAVAGTDDLRGLQGQHAVTWVNVDGLGDADQIRALGEIFGIHRLAQEDIVSVHQRAKVDPYGEQLFVVARMLSVADPLDTEQISMVVAKGVVVTFQERAGDCFDPVRNRIRQAKGRIRSAGADYLAYSLLDAIVDSYFPVIERHGDSLEGMETRVFAEPTDETASEIHQLKRDLILLRRAIWPMREVMSSLLREDSPVITADTRIYLRDCYDHAIQIMDLVDGQREGAADLMNLYLTCVSNKMNEVMKVLTVIATIFIPLTFIAGIYGMNFDQEKSPLNMPELRWYWGYPACLAAMVLVTFGMLVYFARKGWLGFGGSKKSTDDAPK